MLLVGAYINGIVEKKLIHHIVTSTILNVELTRSVCTILLSKSFSLILCRSYCQEKTNPAYCGVERISSREECSIISTLCAVYLVNNKPKTWKSKKHKTLTIYKLVWLRPINSIFAVVVSLDWFGPISNLQEFPIFLPNLRQITAFVWPEECLVSLEFDTD